MKRVLLTTVPRPSGTEGDCCPGWAAREALRARGTRSQGVFAIRSSGTGWGLDFTAANLEAPATVLHYPSRRALARELRRGYDVVGIEFSVGGFDQAVELCALVRRVAPAATLVLGGCGAGLPGCDRHADHVCREGSVNVLRRLLGETELRRFQVPPLARTLRVPGAGRWREAVLPAALGCGGGCGACRATRAPDSRGVPLLRSGVELHEAMRDADPDGAGRRYVGVVEEDFLADRGRIEPMIPLNRALVDEPILFSCTTSLESLSQYGTEELLAMGLSGAWIGLESRGAREPAVSTPDVYREFGRLRGAGIVTLALMRLGMDWHDEQGLEEDFLHLLSLRPQFSRFVIHSPCPCTPLWEELERQGRLRAVPYRLRDGAHALVTHPLLSGERLEGLVEEYARREYEELGPSLLRVAEVRLEGYLMLRYRVQEHLQARARAYRRECVALYPLMGYAIRTAPTERVRRWAMGLREEIEDTFEIPSSARFRAGIMPALAAWARLRNRLRPHPRPRAVVRRYRS